MRALPGPAERSVHYAYEMVALTPAAVRTLVPDYPLSDEDLAKPYLEMSGRRGLGIRADDLLDALFARARGEVLARNNLAEIWLRQVDSSPAARAASTRSASSLGDLLGLK